MTEIDCDVAILHGWLNRVAKVALRGDIDVRGAAGKIDNRLSHAPGGANEQNANARLFHCGAPSPYPLPEGEVDDEVAW